MNSLLLRTLSIRPFSFLIIAEICSQMAMNMLHFVLIVVVYELTHSNTAVAGVVLALTTPAIFFGIPAGAYVDRQSKKTILLYTNIFRMLLLIPFIFFSTVLALVYLLAFCIAVIAQFFIPAETPMIPILVKKQFLLPANALFGMGLYGSVLTGYALTGPLLILLGKNNIFIFLSVLFLIASIFIWLIKVPKHQEIIEKKRNNTSIDIRGEVKTAFSFIVKTQGVYRSLFLLTLSQILIFIFAVIGPEYAVKVLGITVSEFPLYFASPAALGMVAGSFLIGNFLHRISKTSLATVGVFLSGFGILLLPFGVKTGLKNVYDIVALSFMLGIANAFVFVPSNTILQEETAEEIRGKVYGALNALVGIFSLIPILIVGVLADFFGVTAVLVVIGILILLFGVIRVLLHRGR
ncbi:MAG: MFS transporter [Candidatus Levybacteria bacterium]|nr:MFS transporter [Candidatus Levybacteria bacterium]